MIPPEHRAAVTLALSEAFGAAAYEDILDLTERPGSNRAFRIVVNGSPFLLRINTRPGDMPRHFTCMRAAAGAGLAPRVLYANADDRISITDFIRSQPLSAREALVRIPATLRALHALPAFPGSPFNTTCTFLLTPSPLLDGFIQKFRASSPSSENDTAEVFARYHQLVAVYSLLVPDPAPSHNDLFKPDNMLFDGGHLWLVDWEAAFQNDRYADLAVVANMLVASDADEAVFLREYFGEPPDEYRRARFYLMRQLAHMFYAIAFLTLGAPGGTVEASVPAYNDFQRSFWMREAALADAPAKTTFGRVHWMQLMHNIRLARFDEALQIVSGRPEPIG